jgi:hypothetical protein
MIMRASKNNRGSNKFMERLKRKWTNFWNGAVLTIAEEEMRIRREEIERQFGIRERQEDRKNESRSNPKMTRTPPKDSMTPSNP